MIENDDVAAQLLAALTRIDALSQAFADWANGTLDGGPNGDGLYPFPISTSVTVMRPCVERMAFDARVMPRILISGSNNVTLNPVLHQGCFLEIVGGTASSNVQVSIPRNVPASFYCMFAALGSGRLIFSIAGNEGTLKQDQSFDRTRGNGSVGGLYVASRDSGNRPTVYLYGSLVAA